MKGCVKWGYYVNPPNETKEEFLERMGKLIPDLANFKWTDCPTDSLPVILLYNPMFTAAGIAYDEDELNEFLDPDERRRRKLYVVKKDDLLPVSDIGRYLEKHKLEE